MAQGANVPLSTLLLLQFADELEAGWIPSSSSSLPKSDCADIHVNSWGSIFVGHNEDAEPAIKGNAYIVEYEFTGV